MHSQSVISRQSKRNYTNVYITYISMTFFKIVYISMTFVINYFTIPILIYLKFISKFSMTVGTLLTTETAVLKLNKFQVIVRWSSRGDLNLQPFGYQSRTLISTAHCSQYKLQVQKEGLIKIMVNCINQCVQIRKAFWPQLLRSLDTAPLPAPPPAPQASVQNAPDELGSFHGYSLEVLCSQIAFKYIRVTEPVLTFLNVFMVTKPFRTLWHK